MIFIAFPLLLVPILFFAGGSSYYFALSFFGISLLLYKNISTTNRGLLNITLFFLMAASLFLFSTVNGGSIFISLVRALQFCFLYILIFQIFGNIRGREKINMLFVFILLASLVLFIIWLLDSSSFFANRFASFFFDANYFAAVMLLMLVVSNSINLDGKMHPRISEFIMIAFILISFSATVIAILFFYIIASVFFKKNINIVAYPLLILILIISPVISIVAESLVWYLSDLDIASNNFLFYKITSLNLRFESQTNALQIIFNDPLVLLFGIGSGRIGDFLPRATHNGYLNLLFAHGIFVYFFFGLLLCRIYNFILLKYFENHYISIGFFSLLLINIFLDVFFSGLVTAFFFLLSYGLLNKNNALKSETAPITSRP